MNRLFDRAGHIGALEALEFDILVIGGGASGLGVAVDSASRGYRTGLIESGDFANATSSRSTKLVHGGVRYLEQMEFGLVREALHERGLLHRNAPHLVHPLAFVVPVSTGAGIRAVISSGAVPVPVELVALNVPVKTPALASVPLIKPVAGLSVSPGARPVAP